MIRPLGLKAGFGAADTWRQGAHRRWPVVTAAPQGRFYHGGNGGPTELHGEGFMALRAVWCSVLPHATRYHIVRLTKRLRQLIGRRIRDFTVSCGRSFQMGQKKSESFPVGADRGKPRAFYGKLRELIWHESPLPQNCILRILILGWVQFPWAAKWGCNDCGSYSLASPR